MLLVQMSRGISGICQKWTLKLMTHSIPFTLAGFPLGVCWQCAVDSGSLVFFPGMFRQIFPLTDNLTAFSEIYCSLAL